MIFKTNQTLPTRNFPSIKKLLDARATFYPDKFGYGTITQSLFPIETFNFMNVILRFRPINICNSLQQFLYFCGGHKTHFLGKFYDIFISIYAYIPDWFPVRFAQFLSWSHDAINPKFRKVFLAGIYNRLICVTHGYMRPRTKFLCPPTPEEYGALSIKNTLQPPFHKSSLCFMYPPAYIVCMITVVLLYVHVKEKLHD